MVTTAGSAQFRHILGVLRQSGVEPMLSTGVARVDSGSLRVNSVVHDPAREHSWSGTRKFRSMKINAHEQQNELAQRNERSGPCSR